MVYCILGFPGGSDSKESSCNAGDLGSIPGLERSPGGGHGNPLQYSCLENCHGQRSLAGYSPCDLGESDLAMLGLLCHAWAFSSCREWGLLFVVVLGLLIVVASLALEIWLQ